MIRRLKHWAYRHQHPERHRCLETLLANQTLSAAQLRQQQLAEFAELLRHASVQVPYYRERYRNTSLTNLSPDAIRALPILRKDDVVQHRDALLDDHADRATLRIGHTGGSTGKPLAYYYDPHKHELMRAGMMRSYRGSGWRPGEKILNFWGARQDVKPRGLRKRVEDFIAAETTIGAYEYTEADLARWVDEIQRYRPVLLQGYASILAELARYILDQGLRIPDTLKGVYSTAEMLHDWQRQRMEAAFACKVYNQYGSREIPNIACECRHGNQHIFTDMVYLESVHEEGEDKLLVTSLTNRVMPFIRYDIGDAGTLKDGDCPCGSPFPMMEMGVCRSNDLIRTPHGKIVYPSYFIHLLDGLEGVTQYQFVQTAFDKMTLNLLASRRLTAEEQAHLGTRIAREVDADMTLEIRHVEAIPRTRSGKHRFVLRDFV
ncbi:MAG: phenylacetate--CoA ligase family protein [Gammaproteobacteria bacterium]|nr:phenylacetate--CoA ligase family protein [Gammaproteobacteria bacterium]